MARWLFSVRCWAVAALLVALPAAADQFQDAEEAFGRQDYTTGWRLFEELAEAGNARAQAALGIMYMIGDGGRKDSRLAAFWLHKAALQGDAISQYNLAILEDSGEAGVKRPDEAAKWFEAAAENGHSLAMFAIGARYIHGEGVIRDFKKAVGWLARGAEEGDYRAQEWLSIALVNGVGRPRDLVLGYMWNTVMLANSGHERARSANEALKRQLTPEQVAEGDALARECIQRKFKGCGR